MHSKELLSLGLQLVSPWYVKDVEIEKDTKGFILHIHVDHLPQTKFSYGHGEYGVYDHQERTWLHLNFFEHRCIIHARVPRLKLPDGSVKLVQVPWASKGSSFTLQYEYNVIRLLQEGMSCSAVGRRLSIRSKRVFGILQKYVSYALCTQLLDQVKEMAIDETSSKKGHNYLTIISDREAKKIVGVSVGKDKEAVAHALVDMEVRGSNRDQVKCVTMDMSRSYISAIGEYIEQAEIVFDRFHIVKKMNEALDKIRRQERKEYESLKNSRYLWLKNNTNLSCAQKEKVSELSEICPNRGKAYRLKELLKLVLDNAYTDHKITPLNEWMKEAWASNLEPIQDFVNMVRNHWYGIKSYFNRLCTNAFAERVNLKIQEIKRTAKGYRNITNFIHTIYFHLGGLKIIPTTFD